MNLRWSSRTSAGLGAAAGVVALVVLPAGTATASPLFDGASRGPTAAVAIQGALDDAQVTAQSDGLLRRLHDCR